MSQGIGRSVGKSERIARTRRRRLALAVGVPLFTNGMLHGGVTLTWDNSSAGLQLWDVATNWTGDTTAPGSGTAGNDDVAIFNASGTAGTIGFHFGTLPAPFYLGEISVVTSTSRTFGSSGSVAGDLVLSGNASGVMLENTSTGTLTIAPLVTGGTGALNLVLANNGTFNATNGTISISSNISETGPARSLTKAGAGRLVLSGQNTFSGGFTINASGGTVHFGVDSTGTPGSVTSGPIGIGALNINGGALLGTASNRVLHNSVNVGGNFTVGSLNLAGPISLGATDRTITTVTNAATLSGVISSAPGVKLIKAGTQAITITGTANTFDGGVTVSAGTLQLAVNATGAASSALGPGLLTLGGVTQLSSTSATVRSVGNNVSVGGNITTSSITFSGSTFDLGGATRTLTVNGVTTIDSQIINTAGGLTKAGSAATLFLTNPSNSYLGGTTISTGTLSISNNGNLGAVAGNLTISSGGALEVTGSSAVVMNRAVAANSGTISVTNLSSTGLDLQGVVSSSALIRQNGTGTITLSNFLNSFTGTWQVFGGTLALGTSDAFSGGTINLSSPTSTFVANNFNETLTAITGTGVIDLGATGVVTMSTTFATTFSGTITGTGNLTKVGTSALTLSGTTIPGAGVTISSGTVNFTSAASVPGGAGSILLNPPANAVAAFPSPSQANYISRFAPGSSGQILTSSDVSSSWDLSILAGGLIFIGAAGSNEVFYDAPTLTTDGNYFFGGSSTAVFTLPGAVLVDGISPRGVDFGGMLPALTPTIYVDGANTYTAFTTVLPGTTVHIGQPQNTGTPSPLGANGIIASQGTISFLRSGTTNRNFLAHTGSAFAIADGRTVEISSNIGGTGALTKSGPGLLTLSGSTPTYAGMTVISGGTLSISSPSNITASTVSLQGGATSGDSLRVTSTTTIPNEIVINMTSVTGNNRVVGLDAPAGVTATFSGNISNTSNSANTGGLAKYGKGTVVSTAANTMRGGVTVFEGRLALAGASGAMTTATGSNNFSVSGLAVDRNAVFSLDNTAANNNARTPSSWNINLNGGEFELRGNATVNSSATIGSLFAGSPGTLTVTPGSSSTAAQMNIGSMSTLASPYSALLVRGDNLGTAAPGTPGVASVVPTNWIFSGSSGPLGSPTVSLLYHAIADTSSTGGGAGFALVDPARGVRLLAPSEYTTAMTPGQVTRTNFKSSASTPTIDRTTFVNSLYMTNGNTVNSNSLFVPLAASVFQEAGRGTLSGGYLASPNGADLSVWTTGTLVTNSAVHSSTSIVKGGGGALELNGPFVSGAAFVTFGGGTVDFGSTANIGHSPRFSLFNTYVDLSGADRQIGGLSGAFANGQTLGSATVNLGGNQLTLGRGVATHFFDGTITGGGSVTMVNHASEFATQVVTNANSYTGSTNVVSARLQLSGPNGALSSTNALNIGGGILSLNNDDDTDEYSFVNENRLPDSAPINISAGTLQLRGSATAQVRENVGPITISGAATIELTDLGRAVRLDADSLSRSQRGTLVVQDFATTTRLGKRPGLRGSNIILDTPPTLVGGGGAPGTDTVSITPWAIALDASGISFLTYDAATGLRRLEDSEYRAPTMSNTGANIRINGDVILGGTTLAANSFVFNGTPSVALGVATFSPSSGAILLKSSLFGTDVAFDFGNSEGIIHGGGLLDSPIYGTQGVTLASGFFTLPPGGNFQSSGTISFNAAPVFIDLASGLSNSSPLAFSVPAQVNSINTGITDTNSLTTTSFLNNDINLRSGLLLIERTTIGSFSLGGNISGNGGLILGTDTTFTLTGNNTYTGPTLLRAPAKLRLSDDADVGSGGDFVWNGGTVILDGNWNANRNHYVNAGSAIDTNGFQATFNGGVFGAVSNSSTFTKLGSGTLILNGQGDVRANLAITQGAVRLRNSYALGAPSGGGTLGGGTATVSSGAQLQLENNISVDNFININGTGIGGTGAILSFGGNNDLTNTITLSGNSSIGANAASRLRTSAPIQGAFAVTKVGGGIVDFGEASTYTGGTTVDAGSLLVNNVRGSATGTGAVLVSAGATLGGAGSISGAVSVAATAALSPGNSVGTLTTGGVELATASNFLIEIDFTADRADQLRVNGGVTLNGVGGAPGLGSNLVFSFVSGTVTSSPTQTFVLIKNDGSGPVNGTFDGIADDTPLLFGLLQYAVDYNSHDLGLGTDGNDVAVTFTVVPEPAAGALMGTLVLLLSRDWRRSRQNRCPTS